MGSPELSMRDRVDEMTCCVLDCGLSGRELDEYVSEWMAEGPGGVPEDPAAIEGELRRSLADMDPASRAYYGETWERIIVEVRKAPSDV